MGIADGWTVRIPNILEFMQQRIDQNEQDQANNHPHDDPIDLAVRRRLVPALVRVLSTSFELAGAVITKIGF